eukprot:gene17967-biopygen10716
MRRTHVLGMALAAVDGTEVHTLDAAKDAVADPAAGVRLHFQHADNPVSTDATDEHRQSRELRQPRTCGTAQQQLRPKGVLPRGAKAPEEFEA